MITTINEFKQYLKESNSSNVLNYLNNLLTDDLFYMNNNLIKIEVILQYKELYSEIINILENKYEYFLAGSQDDFYDSINSNVDELKSSIEQNLNNIEESGDFDDTDVIFTLIFEPKHNTVYNNVPDLVYHITEKEYLPNILKNGLIAQHKDKISYHPNRVYLFVDKKNISEILNNINFDIDEPVLLTIDVSEFKKSHTFYIDPNLEDGGVYIDENIPANLIIENNEI